jgi:hypothetical protein
MKVMNDEKHELQIVGSCSRKEGKLSGGVACHWMPHARAWHSANSLAMQATRA